MSPNQEKAPEKVALISLFFLLLSVTRRASGSSSDLLLDTVGCRLGARTTRHVLSESVHKKYRFVMRVYLYWKTRNVQARYTSNILYDNLQVLELDHRDGIEAYIEQDQCPFEESVDGICCEDVSDGKIVELSNVPPATRCTLCWMKK